MIKDLIEAYGNIEYTLPNIDDNFENLCLWLFIESYKIMFSQGDFDENWKETKFSAKLIGYMRRIRDENLLALRIDPEGYLYTEAILYGDDDADTSPRIDIKISGNWSHEDYYYAIEAKILIENNWNKKEHTYLKKRYIETGIDNYVEGRYSEKVNKGCLCGYILEGNVNNIVTDINSILTVNERTTEILVRIPQINVCKDCFQSKHIRSTDDSEINLKHIFLIYYQ